MSDVEWMFGDAGSGWVGFSELANLNPLRWSGSETHAKAIADLQKIAEKGSRPIIVKIPSGVSTPSQRFDTPEAAIEYIRNNDPEHLAALAAAAEEAARKKLLREQAEKAQAEVQNREAILAQAQEIEKAATTTFNQAFAAAGKAKSQTCEWMFGDAGVKGFGNIGGMLAHLNPLRWSGARTYDKAKSELEELVQHSVEKGDEQRPVLLRIPPGLKGKETKFEVTSEAVEFLVKSVEGEGDSALTKLEDDKLEAERVTTDAVEKLAQAKLAADKATATAEGAGAMEFKQHGKSLLENEVASANMLAGVYTDPKHYREGTFAGLRFLSVQDGVGATLAGSDDGQTFWLVSGDVFHGSKSVVMDFSPKGGPPSVRGNFDGISIAWEDGNSWTKVHRNDMNKMSSAIEEDRSTEAARAVGSVSGVYRDPNHREERSFAGLRIVCDGEPVAGERSIVRMVGTDDGYSFWALTGKKPTATSLELVMDFSPKGGPPELSGTCEKEGIKWSDGNLWLREP